MFAKLTRQLIATTLLILALAIIAGMIAFRVSERLTGKQIIPQTAKISLHLAPNTGYTTHTI